MVYCSLNRQFRDQTAEAIELGKNGTKERREKMVCECDHVSHEQATVST